MNVTLDGMLNSLASYLAGCITGGGGPNLWLPTVQKVVVGDDMLENTAYYPLVTVDWVEDRLSEVESPQVQFLADIIVCGYVCTAIHDDTPLALARKLYVDNNGTTGLRKALTNLPPAMGFFLLPRRARKLRPSDRFNSTFTAGVEVTCQAKALFSR